MQTQHQSLFLSLCSLPATGRTWGERSASLTSTAMATCRSQSSVPFSSSPTCSSTRKRFTTWWRSLIETWVARSTTRSSWRKPSSLRAGVALEKLTKSRSELRGGRVRVLYVWALFVWRAKLDFMFTVVIRVSDNWRISVIRFWQLKCFCCRISMTIFGVIP